MLEACEADYARPSMQAAWALDNFESSLAEKREASSRLNDMIDNARQELNNINKEKETVRKALCKEPEISLANASWMIDAARTIRGIVNGTKAEVSEIAAESGVDYLKKLGLDIAEDVAEDVDKVAASTTCLFFGFLDGATTISESCGGGGGNNELPKKKDNEDELSFARRCHQMAKAMHAPRYRLRR